MIDAAHSLWYQSPAETWNEALPLGNGRIGAMVFGGIQEERICLNEDTLWSGNPSFHPNPNAFPTWEKIRELIREERFYDAHHLVSTDFSRSLPNAICPWAICC